MGPPLLGFPMTSHDLLWRIGRRLARGGCAKDRCESSRRLSAWAWSECLARQRARRATRAGSTQGDAWSCSRCSTAWAQRGLHLTTPCGPCSAPTRSPGASSLKL
eukprot:8371067-Lingulodinium_polyedra.AAC.1